jgi:methylated-DNA-[protein]-cysteine S-methyltransferase
MHSNLFSKKITSPIGSLFLVANESALIALDNQSSELYKVAIKSENHEVLNRAHKQLDEYFDGKRREFDLPLAPAGSEFQQKAWKALMKIPFGKVWSYGEQAKFLKAPKASRAVGGANGKNPIAIIIPCHRVIGSTGKLTGYAGGMKMKVGLLNHEGHQIDKDSLRLL